MHALSAAGHLSRSKKNAITLRRQKGRRSQPPSMTAGTKPQKNTAYLATIPEEVSALGLEKAA
jgi:hypothetical protein